jgi:hypothetical protein
VNVESTAELQGYLERAVAGDSEARRRLLELTRDTLMRHAHRLFIWSASPQRKNDLCRLFRTPYRYVRCFVQR